MAYKRILTIQDISCVGQCSMTVAIPILSACGHETCMLPTAVLSTHTGGFGKPAAISLEDNLDEMWHHWKEQGISFDCIYTGYLGSLKAVQCAAHIVSELLAPGGIFIADPAMADHGKLYAGFDDAYAAAVADLCRKADIIIPNLTEAAMLLGLPYEEMPDEAQIARILDLLPQNCVIITGVSQEAGKTGFAIRTGERRQYYQHSRTPQNYHGTGDIFASCFTGMLMQEYEPFDAAQIAAEFTRKCIEKTYEAPVHWYGVKFETVLHELMHMIEN